MTRNSERAAEFEANGWQAVVGDVAKAGLTAPRPDVETLVYAVGFDRSAGYDRQSLHPGGLKTLLAQLPNVHRVVYISTTGVYGDSGGGWIDESAPTSPDRESSRVCLCAEQVVAKWATIENHHGTSLRLGGLYGPNRVPYGKQLMAGEELAASPAGYLNLIQVDDAARITCLVAGTKTLPDVLNVTDGEPVIRKDYFQEIARLVGAPEPRYAIRNTTSTRRNVADRQISNARLRKHLAFELQFPSYRDGLADAIENTEPEEHPAR